MKTFTCITSFLFILNFANPGFGAEYRLTPHTFTVPDGFTVERIAGPPLVNRPIEADFDEFGRLYVTDSSGSNEKVQVQLETKPHRIMRLEDTDGDGVFDTSILFADKMMFPEGVMWHDGSLYVSAPPSIWKLTDTDGDGKADQREEWFQGKTLTGCANDLHGPYFGPDGWIYWSKGAFAKQTYERPGKAPFVTRAAHIFRARPDGGGIEPVMTGGMDNPVGVAFLPSGERIFTTTFFQHPGGGKRDGLIHAIYGGVYGKVHDVIEDHKRTGELMPVLTHFGPAAPCGLICYSSPHFGAEFRDNLFACLFNLHKVERTVLETKGATYQANDSDFLVSDNTDFHPTDVLEDADGSLVVIDTGGWYKLCCPTSQLWKPDVLGSIYRIRRSGGKRPDDARGLQMAWNSLDAAQLAELLGDKRAAVGQRAASVLAKGGADAVSALSNVLKRSSDSEARLNAVWTLTRIEGSMARRAARTALSDSDETVRHAATHSVSAWRDREAAELLMRQLEDPSMALRRSAAEALGRIGGAATVERLIRSAAGCRDRILEHSLIYALIEIGNSEVTSSLAGNSELPAECRRVALIALDQMDGGTVKSETVTPLLLAPDPLLKETATWVVGHHPEWARDLAGFFAEQLRRRDMSPAELADFRRLLGQFAKEKSIEKLLAEIVREARTKEARISALVAMAASGVKTLPPAWAAEVTRILALKDGELLPQAVATAQAWVSVKERSDDLAQALLAIANDSAQPEDLRLDALSAVPGGLQAVQAEAFDFLTARVAAGQPVTARTKASGVLAIANLSEGQLFRLTESVQTSGPMEMPNLLKAFARRPGERLGLKLIEALKHSGGLSGTHPDIIGETFAKFPEAVRNSSQELIASMKSSSADQMARLEEIGKKLGEGDIRRGQNVFNSAKAACSSCHAIGYLGGNVGPDLTRIGQIRTEQDLLEAIVYPSASMVRSYEPMIVETQSGEEYSGVLRRDAADEVVLATGPGVETSIARADIFEMRMGTVSVMPGGLDEQLDSQELADLVAFLKATRW